MFLLLPQCLLLCPGCALLASPGIEINNPLPTLCGHLKLIAA